MRSIPGTECASRSYKQYSRASSDREMKSRVLPPLEAVLPLLEEAGTVWGAVLMAQAWPSAEGVPLEEGAELPLRGS